LADLHPAEEADRSQTFSVKSTNTDSERDFAKLDRLIREKPHSTTLALEVHILFSNTKTSSWFTSQTPEVQSELMETARRMSHKHKKKFQEHLVMIYLRHGSKRKMLLSRGYCFKKKKITSQWRSLVVPRCLETPLAVRFSMILV
jgi:hypothetical protein